MSVAAAAFVTMAPQSTRRKRIQYTNVVGWNKARDSHTYSGAEHPTPTAGAARELAAGTEQDRVLCMCLRTDQENTLSR